MRTLASKMERGLQTREWKHYAVYEDELQRFWPPPEKDREAKMAKFAKEIRLSSETLQVGTVCDFRQTA